MCFFCLWLLVVVVVLFSLLVFVWVQCVVEGDLQQQMMLEEFKVVGLDKFKFVELVVFNNWLQGKVVVVVVDVCEQVCEQVKEQVCEEGCQEVIVKNCGFFDFGSSELIISMLEGEFCGFGKGCCYVLVNVQEWEQIDSVSLFGICVQLLQVIIIFGVMGVWYLQVKGVNICVKVCCVK